MYIRIFLIFSASFVIGVAVVVVAVVSVDVGVIAVQSVQCSCLMAVSMNFGLLIS